MNEETDWYQGRGRNNRGERDGKRYPEHQAGRGAREDSNERWPPEERRGRAAHEGQHQRWASEDSHQRRPYENPHHGPPKENSQQRQPHENPQHRQPLENLQQRQPNESSHQRQPHENQHRGLPKENSQQRQPHENPQHRQHHENLQQRQPNKNPHQRQPQENPHHGLPKENSQQRQPHENPQHRQPHENLQQREPNKNPHQRQPHENPQRGLPKENSQQRQPQENPQHRQPHENLQQRQPNKNPHQRQPHENPHRGLPKENSQQRQPHENLQHRQLHENLQQREPNKNPHKMKPHENPRHGLPKENSQQRQPHENPQNRQPHENVQQRQPNENPQQRGRYTDESRPGKVVAGDPRRRHSAGDPHGRQPHEYHGQPQEYHRQLTRPGQQWQYVEYQDRHSEGHLSRKWWSYPPPSRDSAVHLSQPSRDQFREGTDNSGYQHRPQCDQREFRTEEFRPHAQSKSGYGNPLPVAPPDRSSRTQSVPSRTQNFALANVSGNQTQAAPASTNLPSTGFLEGPPRPPTHLPPPPLLLDTLGLEQTKVATIPPPPTAPMPQPPQPPPAETNKASLVKKTSEITLNKPSPSAGMSQSEGQIVTSRQSPLVAYEISDDEDESPVKTDVSLPPPVLLDPQSGPPGLQPGPSGLQPGPSCLQPGPSGLQPGPSGLQPSPSGLQPSPYFPGNPSVFSAPPMPEQSLLFCPPMIPNYAYGVVYPPPYYHHQTFNYNTPPPPPPQSWRGRKNKKNQVLRRETVYSFRLGQTEAESQPSTSSRSVAKEPEFTVPVPQPRNTADNARLSEAVAESQPSTSRDITAESGYLVSFPLPRNGPNLDNMEVCPEGYESRPSTSRTVWVEREFLVPVPQPRVRTIMLYEMSHPRWRELNWFTVWVKTLRRFCVDALLQRSPSRFIASIRDYTRALPRTTRSVNFVGRRNLLRISALFLANIGNALPYMGLTGMQLMDYFDAIADLAAAQFNYGCYVFQKESENKGGKPRDYLRGDWFAVQHLYGLLKASQFRLDVMLSCIFRYKVQFNNFEEFDKYWHIIFGYLLGFVRYGGRIQECEVYGLFVLLQIYKHYKLPFFVERAEDSFVSIFGSIKQVAKKYPNTIGLLRKKINERLNLNDRYYPLEMTADYLRWWNSQVASRGDPTLDPGRLNIYDVSLLSRPEEQRFTRRLFTIPEYRAGSSEEDPGLTPSDEFLSWLLPDQHRIPVISLVDSDSSDSEANVRGRKDKLIPGKPHLRKGRRNTEPELERQNFMEILSSDDELSVPANENKRNHGNREGEMSPDEQPKSNPSDDTPPVPTRKDKHIPGKPHLRKGRKAADQPKQDLPVEIVSSDDEPDVPTKKDKRTSEKREGEMSPDEQPNSEPTDIEPPVPITKDKQNPGKSHLPKDEKFTKQQLEANAKSSQAPPEEVASLAKPKLRDAMVQVDMDIFAPSDGHSTNESLETTCQQTNEISTTAVQTERIVECTKPTQALMIDVESSATSQQIESDTALLLDSTVQQIDAVESGGIPSLCQRGTAQSVESTRVLENSLETPCKTGEEKSVEQTEDEPLNTIGTSTQSLEDVDENCQPVATIKAMDTALEQPMENFSLHPEVIDQPILEDSVPKTVEMESSDTLLESESAQAGTQLASPSTIPIAEQMECAQCTETIQLVETTIQSLAKPGLILSSETSSSESDDLMRDIKDFLNETRMQPSTSTEKPVLQKEEVTIGQASLIVEPVTEPPEATSTHSSRNTGSIQAPSTSSEDSSELVNKIFETSSVAEPGETLDEPNIAEPRPNQIVERLSDDSDDVYRNVKALFKTSHEPSTSMGGSETTPKPVTSATSSKAQSGVSQSSSSASSDGSQVSSETSKVARRTDAAWVERWQQDYHARAGIAQMAIVPPLTPPDSGSSGMSQSSSGYTNYLSNDPDDLSDESAIEFKTTNDPVPGPELVGDYLSDEVAMETNHPVVRTELVTVQTNPNVPIDYSPERNVPPVALEIVVSQSTPNEQNNVPLTVGEITAIHSKSSEENNDPLESTEITSLESTSPAHDAAVPSEQLEQSGETLIPRSGSSELNDNSSVELETSPEALSPIEGETRHSVSTQRQAELIGASRPEEIIPRAKASSWSETSFRRPLRTYTRRVKSLPLPPLYTEYQSPVTDSKTEKGDSENSQEASQQSLESGVTSSSEEEQAAAKAENSSTGVATATKLRSITAERKEQSNESSSEDSGVLTPPIAGSSQILSQQAAGPIARLLERTPGSSPAHKRAKPSAITPEPEEDNSFSAEQRVDIPGGLPTERPESSLELKVVVVLEKVGKNLYSTKTSRSSGVRPRFIRQLEQTPGKSPKHKRAKCSPAHNRAKSALFSPEPEGVEELAKELSEQSSVSRETVSTSPHEQPSSEIPQAVNQQTTSVIGSKSKIAAVPVDVGKSEATSQDILSPQPSDNISSTESSTEDTDKTPECREFDGVAIADAGENTQKVRRPKKGSKKSTKKLEEKTRNPERARGRPPKTVQQEEEIPQSAIDEEIPDNRIKLGQVAKGAGSWRVTKKRGRKSNAAKITDIESFGQAVDQPGPSGGLVDAIPQAGSSTHAGDVGEINIPAQSTESVKKRKARRSSTDPDGKRVKGDDDEETEDDSNVENDNCMRRASQKTDKSLSGNLVLTERKLRSRNVLIELEKPVDNSIGQQEESFSATCTNEATLPTEEISAGLENSSDDGKLQSESSRSITPLSFEKLDKKEVQRYFNRKQNQYAKTGGYFNEAEVSSPSSSTNDATTPSLISPLSGSFTSLISLSMTSLDRYSESSYEKPVSLKDPRLNGNSEPAKIYQRATERRDSFEDPTVSYNGPTTREQGKPKAPISCQDFYNSFGREVSVDIEEETAAEEEIPSDVIDLATSADTGDAITINCRHIMHLVKQEPVDLEPFETLVVAPENASVFLTPEWRFDQIEKAGYNIQMRNLSGSQPSCEPCVPSRGMTASLDEITVQHKTEPVLQTAPETDVVQKPSLVAHPNVLRLTSPQNTQPSLNTGKTHSVTFFEEKAGEIYAQEFGGGKTQRRKSVSRGKGKRKEVAGCQDVLPGRYNRPKTPAHITAEDNDHLFGERHPTGLPRPEEMGYSDLLWADSAVQSRGTITVKPDSQLLQSSKENLVSILKKPKSKSDNSPKRIEFEHHKLPDPPALDPGFSKLVIKLKRSDVPECLIQDYQQERRRQFKRWKRQQEMMAAHERAVARAREMEAKERLLNEKTGLVYCIFNGHKERASAYLKPNAARKGEAMQLQPQLIDYSLNNLSYCPQVGLPNNCHNFYSNSNCNNNNINNNKIAQEEITPEELVLVDRSSLAPANNEEVSREPFEEDYQGYLGLSRNFVGDGLQYVPPESSVMIKDNPFIGGQTYPEDSRSPLITTRETSPILESSYLNQDVNAVNFYYESSLTNVAGPQKEEETAVPAEEVPLALDRRVQDPSMTQLPPKKRKLLDDPEMYHIQEAYEREKQKLEEAKKAVSYPAQIQMSIADVSWLEEVGSLKKTPTFRTLAERKAYPETPDTQKWGKPPSVYPPQTPSEQETRPILTENTAQLYNQDLVYRTDLDRLIFNGNILNVYLNHDRPQNYPMCPLPPPYYGNVNGTNHEQTPMIMPQLPSQTWGTSSKSNLEHSRNLMTSGRGAKRTIKSDREIAENGVPPPAKRGRGRPRKDRSNVPLAF